MGMWLAFDYSYWTRDGCHAALACCVAHDETGEKMDVSNTPVRHRWACWKKPAFGWEMDGLDGHYDRKEQKGNFQNRGGDRLRLDMRLFTIILVFMQFFANCLPKIHGKGFRPSMSFADGDRSDTNWAFARRFIPVWFNKKGIRWREILPFNFLIRITSFDFRYQVFLKNREI